MNVRTTRLLMYLLTAGFVCTSVASIVWAFAPIAPAAPETSPARRTELTTSESSETETEAIVANAEYWKHALRQPLIDPKPQPKPEPPTVRPPVAVPRIVRPPDPKITLIGTILEAGRDVAVFADASGKVDHKSVGGILDLEPEGIRVENIGETMATVSLSGHETTLNLKLKKSKKKGSNSKPKRPR